MDIVDKIIRGITDEVDREFIYTVKSTIIRSDMVISFMSSDISSIAVNYMRVDYREINLSHIQIELGELRGHS